MSLAATLPGTAPALSRLAVGFARAFAPRQRLTVSAWADAHRKLSTKGSAEAGDWSTARNPPLRAPMDDLSVHSPVHDVVLQFPIQFGKTEVAINFLGYTMDHNPGPIMVALPGEVSMNKWSAQKLQPAIEVTPAMARALTSTASRDTANQRTFKDFAGGQLYLEHAGSTQRLKSTTVRDLIVDELTEFAMTLAGSGDDPVAMLDGRTSAFPRTKKRLWISSPGIEGLCRISGLYAKSDQRRYHVACPDCGHEQPLEWAGLHWGDERPITRAWYVCRACFFRIEEWRKVELIRAGRWIAAHPERRSRGYHINCLYYQPDLGPSWVELAQQWIDAQADPGLLKTFVNDRLAEPWEDPAMRAVKHSVIRDRAEPYRLRTAPEGVLAITAGVDTQDNRLAVQVVGWGRNMAAWVLDYVELPGDPAEWAVWAALTELLNRPIEHANGALLRVEAVALDAGGHRTEAVKDYVRRGLVRRPLCIFGAVPNNAPVLSKGKLQDVTWQGKLDKQGVTIHHVGTVGIKHWLYARLSRDGDKDKASQPEARLVRFSDELPAEYFAGVTSETYNPTKNRFDVRKGARNEALDTWVYAFAAAHHPELRLHRLSRADWDGRAARIADAARHAVASGPATPLPPAPRPTPPPRPRGGLVDDWSIG